MKYLLRNTIRDPAFERRRVANPSLVSMRPWIGGSPLGPGASRVLESGSLTAEILDEVETHQRAGNVQLIQVGGSGGEADIQALRQELGFVSEPAPEPEPEPAPEPTPEPAPEPAPAPEPEEEEDDASEEYTESQLLKLKNSDLRDILSDEGGGSGSGLTKKELVAEILELQGD